MVQLEEDGEVSLPWVDVHSVIYETYIWESVCHGYMCILLYMQVIWCSSFPDIYAQLEVGGGVSLPLVDVHSAIYESYLVYSFSRDLLLIRGGGGSVCHGYMCILLYMKLIWCSGFPEIYAQLQMGVGSVCHGVYVHSAM